MLDFVMSGSVSSFEGELNAIVKEYLEHLGLEATVVSFEKECQKLGKPIQDNAASRRDERTLKIQNELFQDFDYGKRLEFFSAWESYISPDVRSGDIYCQKLEFLLHIHFAVFPLRAKDHWVKDDAEEAMFHFRYYLETKGSALSQTTEFLPYYALPYVPTPKSHPSFKDLFKDTWVKDLRNRLETFLWEVLKDTSEPADQPRLLELFLGNDMAVKDACQELKSAEKRLEESEKRCILQARKLEKIQDDCQKLMAVTSHLITALESAVKGDLIDMDCVLNACTTRFPDVFKLHELESNTLDSNVFKNTEKSETLDDHQISKESLNNKSNNDEEIIIVYPPLNFAKMKKDLPLLDMKSKTLLLQALRLRLTRSPPKQRIPVLNSYISNDLLGFSSPSEYTQCILNLLKNTSDSLKQTVARFLNAFVSFGEGRRYIAQCPQLIEVLMNNLSSKDECDQLTQDMMLGTLQKLSMRHTLQNNMIEGGLIEWLIGILTHTSELTDYSLEYGTALFMNLSLSSAGKTRCISVKEKVLSALRKLLRHKNKEVLPYVNGALYSLLSVPDIKLCARNMVFQNTLEEVKKDNSTETCFQLDCVLKKLNSDDTSETSSSEDDDDVEEEEQVNLELELDKDDPVTDELGEINEEKQLSKYYEGADNNGSDHHEASGEDAQGSNEEDISQHENDHDCNSSALNKDSVDLSGTSFEEESPTTSQQIGSSVNREKFTRSSSVPASEELSPSPQNAQSGSDPETPKLDFEATKLVRRIIGEPEKTLVEAATSPNPTSFNIIGLNVHEYTVAFSSRPKIPRTPEPSTLPTPSPAKSKKHRSSISHL